MNMTINILISTIDEGINRVPGVLLDPQPGITWRISHQYTGDTPPELPAALLREDVAVQRQRGRGVTRSRNHAIEMADADIALFSDDDVRYTPADMDILRRTFEANPRVDVAIFKIRTLPGEPEYRDFPAEPVTYTEAPVVGTPQIAFRVDRVRAAGIRFDERFGGSDGFLRSSSNERVFVHDCLQAGLNVTYIPEYIVQHPYHSAIDGIPKYATGRVRMYGAVDARMNGWRALPKAVAGTFSNLPKLRQNRKNPFSYCRERLQAALYILRTGNGTTGNVEQV